MLAAIAVFIALAGYGTRKIVKLAYPTKYSEYVFTYSLQYNLDPFLVFAIIKAESGFNPKAVSRKNAKGLMQISDKTGFWAAKELKIEEFTADRLFDPETNIRIGCWYLNKLSKEKNFRGNLDLIIAAYNGGSGNVRDWLSNPEYSETGTSLKKIPFAETEVFLRKVKKYYNIYKKLYKNGILRYDN